MFWEETGMLYILKYTSTLNILISNYFGLQEVLFLLKNWIIYSIIIITFFYLLLLYIVFSIN